MNKFAKAVLLLSLGTFICLARTNEWLNFAFEIVGRVSAFLIVLLFAALISSAEDSNG